MDQNTTFLFYEIFCLCKQKMGFVYISKNLTFKRLDGFCCPVRLFWSTFQAKQLLFQRFCWCMPQNLDRTGPCSEPVFKGLFLLQPKFWRNKEGTMQFAVCVSSYRENRKTYSEATYLRNAQKPI